VYGLLCSGLLCGNYTSAAFGNLLLQQPTQRQPTLQQQRDLRSLHNNSQRSASTACQQQAVLTLF
jgi:hypothetical protein